MRDTDSNKFIAYLAIIATPFALGAFLLSWAPAKPKKPKIPGQSSSGGSGGYKFLPVAKSQEERDLMEAKAQVLKAKLARDAKLA